jgi:hypothetical protein
MLAAPERFRPARADWIQAGLVGLALFVVYAATAVRTVATEDDGLFVLSSYFLGIEHPPGYPLFTLIGHLFTSLPFGSVAYRVHLASGLFGALTGAAAWLCARSLIPGRAPAYLVALGLGLSPVFWSQAVIAEVYTLNTFFFLVVVYIGLQACPPVGPGAESRRTLAWMAVVFGLSLSNHYPLMFLVAPGFVILLWPLRADLLRRLPLLLGLVLLGLLPYAWLVVRSWQPLPISFYGPLETPQEIWYFLSRSGYASIDRSLSANWIDQIRFLEFFTSEFLFEFAFVGTLLAVTGFAVQWRVLGRRISSFLTAAFLGPSVVLILLLNFDYDTLTKHVYSVYPLPAYAVAALWMGLGFAWLVDRYGLRAKVAAALGLVVLAAISVSGARSIQLDDEEWLSRYARAVLKVLPKDAVVFVLGDPDVGPIGYFHMIEGQRPDITLYSSKGLVLGNRMFHPERTSDEDSKRIVKAMIEDQTGPVVATLQAVALGSVIDRWLYAERDSSSHDRKHVTVDIPEEAMRFFEEDVAQATSANAWLAFIQSELRHQYAVLLARSLRRGVPIDTRKQRQFELLGEDFYGALGITEGLMLNEEGYSAGVAASYLDKARDLMPSDVVKPYRSRYFHLRGGLRAHQGDFVGALEDFDTALSTWPSPANPAIAALEDFFKERGDTEALSALEKRVNSFKKSRP